MSVIKLTLINCDGCGETFASGDDKINTATEQRKGFNEDGWINRGTQDFCIECRGK